MKYRILLLILLLVWGGMASAQTASPTPTPSMIAGTTCTRDFTIGTTPVQIFPANNPNGSQPRHFLLIQNKGPANDIWCLMNSNNTCVSGFGYHFRAGDQWLLNTPPVPSGDVCCVATTSPSQITACQW